MNDLITVVIPVYKVEEYLDRCINSIVNQTYKKLEIILVDDGSPDNCPKMCDEWAKKDKRIRVIHKKNGGLSDARNCGIEKATGRYITFVDSDDWMILDAIESLYFYLKKHDADISCGDHIKAYDDTVFEKKNKVNCFIYSEEEALENMMYSHGITNSAWGKLYKLEYFDNIKYPKGKLYEDLGTTYKLFSKSTKIVYIDYPIYYYYQGNANSIMHNNYSSRRLEALEFAEEELKFIKKKYPNIISSAKYRLFSECVFILNEMPLSHNDKKRVKKVLKSVRKGILFDKKLYLRQTILCLSSYFGHVGIKIAYSLKRITRGR